MVQDSSLHLSSSQSSHQAINNSPDLEWKQIVEYCAKHGGNRPIQKILISNNGIAAVKKIRSVRKWAYEVFGNERIIQFVVMATPEDLKANAEYIRMADFVIPVPGGTNNNNYANVALIVDIALRTKVQAVWAGWGHASENPRLPESLSKANIVFIGPSAAAMRALGDKISSMIVAQTASVPTIDWSGTGLSLSQLDDYDRVETVPDEIYAKACVKTSHEALQAARRIGFPVMIKASEGGGGKGIRKADSELNFDQLFRHVEQEVPGSPVFIMKLAREARHLEVQLLCDQHGNAITLFGRDCSIQRRHQKIIEEAPVTIAPEEVCLQMEAAAIRLAQLVGYENAGTVEYLYDPKSSEYTFLELNPRLQVEHPCTEMVSNVNIPAAQLLIAMGIPLYRIDDIRRLFNADPKEIDKIELTFKNRQRPHGHVIACRVTSENPDAGFKPGGGKIVDLSFKSGPGIWGYFAVGTNGSSIHEYSDSQFGHLFSHSTSRIEALKTMVVALKDCRIRAEFRSITEYLVAIMETMEFQENRFSTAFLDGLIAQKFSVVPVDSEVAVICCASVQAILFMQERLQLCKDLVDKRQVPPETLMDFNFSTKFVYHHVQYHVQATPIGPEQLLLHLNQSHTEVRIVTLTDGGFLLTLQEGKTFTVYSMNEHSSIKLLINGKICILEKENDPTIIRSPSPGRITRLLVEDGCTVEPGMPIAELEVMKMYMPLIAEQKGIITFTKYAGVTIEAGEIIAILKLLESLSTKPIEVCKHGFSSNIGSSSFYGSKPDQLYDALSISIKNVLDGYLVPMDDLLVSSYLGALGNKLLPFYQLDTLLSSLAGRIPKILDTILSGIIQKGLQDQPSVVLLKEALAVIDELGIEKNDSVSAIRKILERHVEGSVKFTFQTIVGLIDKFLDVERFFDDSLTEDNSLANLRINFRGKIEEIVKILISHNQLENKMIVICKILESLVNTYPNAINDPSIEQALRRLTKLNSSQYGKISRKARELFLYSQLPSPEQLKRRMEFKLLSAVGVKSREMQLRFIQEMVQGFTTHLDALPTFFHHKDPRVALLSMEIYIRRNYETYLILKDNTIVDDKLSTTYSWIFTIQSQLVANSIGERPANFTVPPSSSAPEESTLANNDSVKNSNDTSLPKLASKHDIVNGEEENFVSTTANNSDELTRQKKFSEGVVIEERGGLMTTANNLDELNHLIPTIIAKVRTVERVTRHVIYIAILEETLSDLEVIAKAEPLIQPYSDGLRNAGVRRLTIIWIRKALTAPGYFTFREMLNYKEDCLARHIEPAMAYLLEFNRISANYNVKFRYADLSGQIHIYEGTERSKAKHSRLFVRLLVRPNQALKNFVDMSHFAPEANRILEEVLEAVETVLGNCVCNSLYINILPVFYNRPEDVQDVFVAMMEKYKKRFMRLRINQADIRMNLAPKKGVNSQRYRFLLSNPTGYIHKVDTYLDVKDPLTDTWKLHAIHPPAPLDGHQSNFEYPNLDSLQTRRNKVHALGSAYIYDFPSIFEFALRQAWETVRIKRQYNRNQSKTNLPSTETPGVLLTQKELVIQKDQLVMIEREAGMNTCGMVAWLFTLFTPEEPTGRQIIVIGNDLTFEIGSFGVAEDRLFYEASCLARKLGIPRIFLSANSGARLGLAEELKDKIKIGWRDDGNPLLGFDYLYLTEKDYQSLPAGCVNVVEQQVSITNTHLANESKMETRLVITDIIGSEDGIGVENLSGSGLIAGETSTAYNDIFTLSLVSGRSVGIGAYLVRLGQRVIQKEEHPIILTGVAALNKVLGREVYRNNLQIGGPQIMYANGITHRVVVDDMEGVNEILQWLSFVPAKIKRSNRKLVSYPPILPILDIGDDPYRKIGYHPPQGSSSHDPRFLITGVYKHEQSPSSGVILNHTKDDSQHESEYNWIGGFFDKDSFVEYLAGWARTVIVGKARLGGIPVGIICTETRTIEKIVPADPANPATEAQTVLQAGQVWFPDSASKTAQFIRDCNRGECLPLFIFANWRGFSGGQRDLYDEILKFGSQIVDALCTYQQPVFVYLPPDSELRGGSWVVVDSQINPRRIEMYADPGARGGIIEPEGIVAIKFRSFQLSMLMRRLDDNLNKLYQEKAQQGQETKTNEIDAKIKEREKLLMPLYNQVACHFADCHDRVGRMKAKHVIRDVVPWIDSRGYFYDRLCRLLEEDKWTPYIMEALQQGLLIQPNQDYEPKAPTVESCLELLYNWCGIDWHARETLNDRDVFKAIQNNRERLQVQVEELCQAQQTESLLAIFRSITDLDKRQALLSVLKD